MKATFLNANWRKLMMVNYPVDPQLLTPYLPAGTQLDLWNDRCYVSLVGFMFTNTRLMHCSIPFHRDFEEVNLRFYVKHTSGKEVKRGVVFIKELVPKPAITWVANHFYKEKYETVKMTHTWTVRGSHLEVQYHWKKQGTNAMRVTAVNDLHDIIQGSEEEFITEHYWGYARKNSTCTMEYQVEHERWRSYPVKDYDIHVDFEMTYGKEFQFLNDTKPLSVFLVEGSPVVVRKPLNLLLK